MKIRNCCIRKELVVAEVSKERATLSISLGERPVVVSAMNKEINGSFSGWDDRLRQ
jgi:hypothetical protein